MKLLRIAIGCAAVFFLTGCSDGGSKGKSVSTRATRGNPTTQSVPGSGSEVANHEDFLPQGQELSGEIFETANKIGALQDSLDHLLSSFMDPAYIDYDRNEFGLYNAATGISFGASIEFEGINYSPGQNLSSTTVVDVDDVHLRVSVFDELVGSEYINDDGEYKVYTEIPMDFSELSDYEIINGQRMSFVFEDVYGYIMFTSRSYGGITQSSGQSLFYGDVYFANKTSIYDADDYDRNWIGLGRFAIPTCQFFRCN